MLSFYLLFYLHPTWGLFPFETLGWGAVSKLCFGLVTGWAITRVPKVVRWIGIVTGMET